MPFVPLKLSPEGAPIYHEHETTLQVATDVVLEHSGSTACGKIYLTTHRLLWVSSSPSSSSSRTGSTNDSAQQLALHHVHEVEQSSKGTFRKKYFIVITGTKTTTTTTPEGETTTGTATERASLRLQNARACMDWMVKTQTAVMKVRRAFEEAAKAKAAGGGTGGQAREERRSSGNTVGVAGRRRARTSQIEQQSQLAASAFESIESLKVKAKEIVSMIEAFAQNPSNTAVTGSGGAASSAEDDQTKQQFQSLLQTVGIANPVLRDSYVVYYVRAVRCSC